MTSQELQIAVAEKMGWKHILTGKFPEVDFVGVNPHGTSGLHTPIPPYSTSLDAIQAACLEMFKDNLEAREFGIQQVVMLTKLELDYVWQLSAADWCEAFLATCKAIEDKEIEK